MQRTAALFLKEFWHSPRSIGAALPSSRALADAMLAPVDFATTHGIIEFGPGTGAVTAAIAARLRPGNAYIGIELNEAFWRSLQLAFPDLAFERESVEHLGAILARHGLASADAIICGLPWASFPLDLQARIFAQIERHLSPGGVFVTFAYLSGLVLPGAQALRRRLRQSFAHVSRTPTIWRNVPPAFAYVCRR